MRKLLTCIFAITLPLLVAAQDCKWPFAKRGYSSFEETATMADQGDVKAMQLLAHCYENGICTDTNPELAFHWYQLSAKGGNVSSMNQLGVCYERGIGIEPDIVKAFDWYNRAARATRPSTTGIYNLALCYEVGKGINANLDSAFSLYSRSALMGQAKAMNKLSTFYRKGNELGINQDLGQAVYWANKSAEQGNIEGIKSLAEFYRDGIGVPQDLDRAWGLYQSALEAGDPSAHRYMDNMRDNGYVPANERNNPAIQPREPVGHASDVDTNIPVTNKPNEKTFAIIIANENYKSQAPVMFAKHDGETVKDYIQATLGVPESNIRMIQDATFSEMSRRLRWLTETTKNYGNDIKVIFYYAGHGIPASNGKSYLLPVDGDVTDPMTMLAIEDVYDALGQIPTKGTFVFFDACFSGSQRGGGMLSNIDLGRGVAYSKPHSKPTGQIMAFTAVDDKQEAWPYKIQGHGLFTYFVLKKIQETKGNVKMGELVDYVTDEVRKKSMLINDHKQTPTLGVAPSIEKTWRGIKIK